MPPAVRNVIQRITKVKLTALMIDVAALVKYPSRRLMVIWNTIERLKHEASAKHNTNTVKWLFTVSYT